jgi:hypothetical protein
LVSNLGLGTLLQSLQPQELLNKLPLNVKVNEVTYSNSRAGAVLEIANSSPTESAFFIFTGTNAPGYYEGLKAKGGKKIGPIYMVTDVARHHGYDMALFYCATTREECAARIRNGKMGKEEIVGTSGSGITAEKYIHRWLVIPPKGARTYRLELNEFFSNGIKPGVPFNLRAEMLVWMGDETSLQTTEPIVQELSLQF